MLLLFALGFWTLVAGWFGPLFHGELRYSARVGIAVLTNAGSRCRLGRQGTRNRRNLVMAGCLALLLMVLLDHLVNVNHGVQLVWFVRLIVCIGLCARVCVREVFFS